MICLAAFAIFEGALYVIEALFCIVLVFMIPKGWVPKVKARMPVKTKSGVNKLEF